MDELKYIQTIQGAILELDKYKQLCPQTVEKLNKEKEEIEKILKC